MASNWDANRVPTAADDAVIPQPSVTVRHTFGIDSVRSLVSQANLIISGGTLALGNAISQTQNPIRVLAGGTLTLNNATLGGAGTLVNEGTLVAQGSSNLNGAFANAAGATLRLLGGQQGAALLTLASGFTNEGLIELTSQNCCGVDATLAVSNGTLTNAPGATIQSLPGIGGSRTLNARLDNQGTIYLLSGLTLSMPSAAHVNAGTISLIGGDFTVNQSGVPQTFSSSGVIQIGSGTVFTVNGGSFTNFTGSAFTGGTYHIAGTLRFPNAAISTCAATVTLEGPAAQIVDHNGNNALVNLNRITEVGSFTILYGRNFATNSSFSNAGTLAVGEGSTFAAPLSNFAGTTLTGGTFVVSGTLRVSNAVSIQTNAATLVLEWPTASVLNQSNTNALANFTNNAASGVFRLQGGRNLTTAAFTNAGILTVGVGSTFTASGTYTQTGGTTMLVGGTLAAGTLVDLRAGVLSGSGAITANVRNAALIEVGGSGTAGSLAINGSYTQTTNGTLNLELGALDSGDFDALQITGTADLDGTLNVTLLESFVAREGDSFGVLTFASVTGQFATLNLPDIGEGMFLNAVYDEVSTTALDVAEFARIRGVAYPNSGEFGYIQRCSISFTLVTTRS